LIPFNSLEGPARVKEMSFYRSFHNYLSSRSEEIIKILNENYEMSKKLGYLFISFMYHFKVLLYVY